LEARSERAWTTIRNLDFKLSPELSYSIILTRRTMSGQPENDDEKQTNIALGLSLGLAIGMSLGVSIGALTGNFGLWIPLGMMLAISVAVLIATLGNERSQD
jgi:F0F1-type ATP synthase assembly protein I